MDLKHLGPNIRRLIDQNTGVSVDIYYTGCRYICQVVQYVLVILGVISLNKNTDNVIT